MICFITIELRNKLKLKCQEYKLAQGFELSWSENSGKDLEIMIWNDDVLFINIEVLQTLVT